VTVLFCPGALLAEVASLPLQVLGWLWCLAALLAWIFVGSMVIMGHIEDRRDGIV
jgi:hypothetical protein